MTNVAEYLADVMAKGCQDQLVVGTRSLRSRRSLQSVLQLTDLPAVAHVRQAGETAENSLCSATLPTHAIHKCRLPRPRSAFGHRSFARTGSFGNQASK